MARWSIPIDKLAAKSGLRIDTVARKVIFESFSRVVQRSPVDTGRFRANWNISYSAPDKRTTVSTNSAATESALKAILTQPVGDLRFLCNSLPYAVRLEYGWSRQAPTGMVRLTAAEMSNHVKEAIRSL